MSEEKKRKLNNFLAEYIFIDNPTIENDTLIQELKNINSFTGTKTFNK